MEVFWLEEIQSLVVELLVLGELCIDMMVSEYLLPDFGVFGRRNMKGYMNIFSFPHYIITSDLPYPSNKNEKNNQSLSDPTTLNTCSHPQVSSTDPGTFKRFSCFELRTSTTF